MADACVAHIVEKLVRLGAAPLGSLDKRRICGD